MSTTITISTDALGQDFIESLKKMFPHKKVEITVTEADTQEYIESNPKYKKELLKRIADFDKKKKNIALKENEII